MCLTTPGRIVRITSEGPFPTAEVDFGPVVRSAQLAFLPEARVGDYVFVQAGFAIRRLSEDEAREARAAAAELSRAEAGEARASRAPTGPAPHDPPGGGTE